MHRHVAGYVIAAVIASAAPALAGCANSGGASPAVPSLSQSAPAGQGAGGGGSGTARASALHAAAQCIRRNGVPGYADPVLTPSGQVYTDSRSMQGASQPVLDAIRQGCGTLLAQANLDPVDEPPAPPQLVQAGVRAAQCLRAHGMPNVTDPTARSTYTPGHGFGMTASEFPPGGKTSPVWQHARYVCSAQLTAEIQASSLASLGDEG